MSFLAHGFSERSVGPGNEVHLAPASARRLMVIAVALLMLFSIVAVVSAVGTYKISMEGSRNLLETRATDVAVNIGFALEKVGLDPELFPRLVQSDRWDYVAYLALMDRDGTVLLHSNMKIIGRTVHDSELSKVIREQKIITRFQKIATGEELFMLDFPLKLHLPWKSSERDRGFAAPSRGLKPYPKAITLVLRVALHPYPAETIERRAKFQLIMIVASLGLLWGLSLFFIRLWRNSYKLEKRLQEQERLAALGQMAAVLAHEIRNPLSSIKGFAQLHMEDDCDPDLSEDMRLIVTQVERLERLTENLLIYARPAVTNLQEFNLQELCAEFQRIIPSYEMDTITLHLHCDDTVVVQDREKFMQIILNLFQNAVEALGQSQEKGPGNIWIDITVDDQKILLGVEDDGPGIPEEMKKVLFQPFVTSKTKGTGLGLAIVKRLADEMGGEVFLEQGRSGGTRIVVMVPADIQAPDQDGPEEF